MTYYLHEGGSVLKSNYKHSVNHLSPLSPYTRHLRRDISSCALFTVCSERIMLRRLTPIQVINHQSVEGQSKRKYEPSKNGGVAFNNLHMHQGSPLLPVVHSLLSHSLHRHPSFAQSHFHAIHPT